MRRHGLRPTAPEDDMVTFVAQNHSLSMWAYAKNNDDSYSDTCYDEAAL